MAIERYSPTANSDSHAFVEHLLLLWQRKLTIVGFAVAVGVLTYLAMWFVPEEFEAKAAVYVNKMNIYDIPPVSPMTVAALAQNPELLKAVYDDYAARYGRKPGDFEKFVKQFEVKTDILQDTTVKKEISPVLELKVKYRGREETAFLLRSWLEHLVRKFGNVSVEEARLRRAAMNRQDEALDKELRNLESERASLANQLVHQRKLIAEMLDILAPADYPEIPLYTAKFQERGVNNFEVYVNQRVPKPEGLMRKYLVHRLELERARAGLADAVTTPIAQLEKEEQVLSATISQCQEQLRQLEKVAASIEERLATVTRNIEEKRRERQQLHNALDIFSAIASAYVSWDGKGLPAGADIRVLSMPVTPDLRVWPKRTLVAALAMVLAAILCVFYLALRHMVESWNQKQTSPLPPRV